MLHFPKLLLLTDDEVNTAYCNAFLDATEDATDQSCSLVIPNAARCPGLLPLLAHPQSKLRCRVSEKGLPPVLPSLRTRRNPYGRVRPSPLQG
jgi:hypothetical protein